MKTMVKAMCGDLTGAVVSTKSQRKVRQRPSKCDAKGVSKILTASGGEEISELTRKGQELEESRPGLGW